MTERPRRRHGFNLVPPFFAESVKSPRLRLGHAPSGTKSEMESEPRVDWCTPNVWPDSVRVQELGTLTTGLHVAVRLVTGDTWVGTTQPGPGRALVLRVWGRPDRMVFPFNQIAGCRPTGAHRAVDEQAIRRRQRQGLPALLLEPVPP